MHTIKIAGCTIKHAGSANITTGEDGSDSLSPVKRYFWLTKNTTIAAGVCQAVLPGGAMVLISVDNQTVRIRASLFHRDIQ